MRYTIYRGNEVVVQNIHPEGTVTTKIMGEETAALSFTLPFDISFKLEDRIHIYGKNFFLADTPTIDKKSSREYIYTMSFLSLKYTLRDIQLMFYDENNELTMPAMPFMGTAEKALDMVMLNIARLQPGWTKGVVDETEVKNVEFTECNCLEALSKIAETFELEFWVDDDKSIHFTERKPVSGYSFEYGKGKGLKNINRKPLEGASIVTRLYVKGSEKNLPKNYRKGQKNLRMDVPYLEKNTDIYGIKEHTETFDIYPKYEGTVTAVDADPHRFIDTGIDFDLNAYDQYGTTVLMNGVNVKVIFQTGQLAGYTLELLEAGGFNYNTKTFYLQTNKDEKAMEVPSELLRPAVGDKYILVDLMMPAQYVTNAEAELKTKGQEYLDQNCKDRFQYSMGSDRMYFKAQNVNLVLGSTVHFKDAAFALDDDIRVTSLSVDIQDPYEVKFDLNESSAVSSIVQSYYDQQSQQTTIINTVKYNAELARRNYLFAREFHDNVFDGEGYFDMENIKPLSIETKMLSLGSRMQQFALPGVDFKLANNNAMMNTAGKLSHQTIDPNGIRDWNIAANSVIGISNNFNYIYIKAQRVGSNANFVVTEAQIKVEQDPDFYYFEVGYLSSVIDGYRKIKTTYGFAQLNPAELSIGRISDPTGNNYIDLLQDRIAIKAKVEFTSDSPAIQQVNDQIVVGGRNLLIKTKDFGNVSNSYKDGTTYQGLTVINSTKTNGSFLDLFNESTIVELTGSNYILSFYARASAQMNIKCHLYSPNTVLKSESSTGQTNNIVDGDIQVTISTEWERYWVKWEQTGVSSVKNIIVGRILDNNIKLELAGVMFSEGNKAMDWTPAPEDIDVAVAGAQATANTAMSGVNDMANDNKLTANEKQTTVVEWNRIKQEYTQNSSIANTLGISLTAYQNAYNTLNTYITPLLSNLTTTSTIDGTTFRNNFQNYYTQNVSLVQAIENKKIDNIQVGGRNYFQDSQFIRGFNVFVGGTAELETVFSDTDQDGRTSPLGHKVIKMYRNGAGDNFVYLAQTVLVEPNTQYTVSFYQNGAGAIFANSCYVYYSDGTHQVLDFTLNKSTTYIRQKITFTTKAGISTIQFRFGFHSTAAAWISVASIKLEKGNKATDWTPAPEDIDSAISTANAAAANALAQAQNAQSTAAAVQQITSFMQSTVLGNVMATGSLLVGDVNGGNGGITGVTDQGSSSVRFWTGAIYANKNRARWTMCDDGIERCYYPNGQLSSERGYDALNNRFLYNMYDSIGNPIFMLDTVRGLIAPTYIDETYLIVPLFNFGLSSETLDVNAAVTKIQNTGISHIIQEKEVKDENGFYITVPYHIVSLITNYTAYDYNNGTKPTNQQYAYLAGYKASKNRTDNIPNGWYIRYYHFVQYEMPGQTFSRNSGAVITYYKDGVVYKTQSISFVIPVGVNG